MLFFTPPAKMFLTDFPTVRETPLQKHLKGNKVRCGVCERKCVISEGKRGFCEAKENIKGTLYSLTYGNIAAQESRPIEIKPFYHYYPGTTAYTIATFSCNFRCPWCQNFHLSRSIPHPESSLYTSPEAVLQQALDNNDRGLCISFTEPTLLFEYALQLFPLGRKANLYCCFVSNGYMSEEALQMLIAAGLDGLKIDIKGGSASYEKLGLDDKVPWRNVQLALEKGIHVEVVYLLVTGFNDDLREVDEVLEKHLRFAGKEVPLHINRYFPAYRYREPATDIEILKEAARRGKEKGIRYVYVGNVHEIAEINTYCPSCSEILIERRTWGLKKVNLADKKCPSCGEPILLYGEIGRAA
jgi:pyruvate formate lyase activating enzyme